MLNFSMVMTSSSFYVDHRIKNEKKKTKDKKSPQNNYNKMKKKNDSDTQNTQKRYKLLPRERTRKHEVPLIFGVEN